MSIPPFWGSPRKQGLRSTCGPPVILPPALKRWGPPGGRGYVATLPTCGPPVILPPALKRWGPPRRQGLCSLWPVSCLWCGSTDGKCGTSVHGKKIDSNCSPAYHRLRLNSAATPTAMNPSTNLPVRCKVLDCRKWHCTYAMPHHMAQAHPGVSHDYAGCSKEEKTKVLQAFDNFQAPLPPKAKPAAPPALPTVLPALLSGPNQGSSSGSRSSSSSTTNASSSTSASSSNSAPLGTVSDYVPSESMSDGPAACRVIRLQAAWPKKRARPKSTGKRARDEWEDDSDA